MKIVTAKECVDWLREKHKGEDFSGCWKFYSLRKVNEHYKVWTFKNSLALIMETVHVWDGVISDKVPKGEKL